MLSQLEFKLSVEKQYKEGIEKLVRLYQDDGDRKSRAEAEGRRIESNQKVQLLRQALKKYTDLHVDVESNDQNDGQHPSLTISTCRRDANNCNRRKLEHAQYAEATNWSP